MFTGIIEQVSNITGIKETSKDSLELTMARPAGFEIGHGDSISVDGCCLTVARFDSNHMSFDVSLETLNRTTFRLVTVGSKANIERALCLGGRLGGHLVSGHIDTVGSISHLKTESSGWELGFQFDRTHAHLVIPKGSIAIQGISLTINEIMDLKDKTEVRVMLIPTTLQKTTLATTKLGQLINIEFDLIGKYVLRNSQISHV